MNDAEFKPSEDDILVMLRHLRYAAPEHTTPEKAIFLLGQQHVHYKTLEELYPELIEEILNDFEKY